MRRVTKGQLYVRAPDCQRVLWASWMSGWGLRGLRCEYALMPVDPCLALNVGDGMPTAIKQCGDRLYLLPRPAHRGRLRVVYQPKPRELK